MRLVLAAAALAVAASAVPAGADATVCVGRITVRPVGVTVVDHEIGCHTVDTP